MKPTYTTQEQIRDAFWQRERQLAEAMRRSKRQNDYNPDIRTAFVDFVDSLQKSGEISEKLADRVTL